MLSMTAGWEAEKNKKTGAKPVWILKIPFVAGTLYLSDRVVTYTGITVKPWVTSWGQINEEGGDLSTTRISDFSAEIIIDPAEATDIHDLLWSESVETLDCELYLWFEGLTVATDPMIKVWTGNIIDFIKLHELACKVDFVDQGVKWDKCPGRVLSLVDYANAALDDVGYQMPIGYGALTKVPALRLDAAKKTTLISDLDGVATDFYISDGTGFANGTHIICGTEEIEITTISGNHITACNRAHNSTTAEVHNAGALVIEKKTTVVFLYLDHPVKSIGNIYARRPDGVDVDITALCTKYTGNGGATDLAGYAGKAVVTCPGYITFAQAVEIGLVDTMGISTTTSATLVEERLCAACPAHIHQGETIGVNYTAMPSGDTIEKWIEISWAVLDVTYNSASQDIVAVAPDEASATHFEIAHIGSGVLVEPQLGSPVILTLTNANPWPSHLHLLHDTISGNNFTFTITSMKQCQRVTPAISSTRTGALSVSGTQTADIIIADNIFISGEGYADDGGGTFTGTASALIARPDHVMKHFLYTYASLAVANFSTDTATPFAADSYAFSVVMNQRKKLREWCASMAWQCRCWFRFANSKAYLLYRPDSLSSDKTIAKFADNSDHTTTMKISRSPLSEIINKVTVHYSRDWSRSDGREAYQAVTTTSDATSIAAYGEKENPDLFLFDFVALSAMATDLRDFYLARMKDRKKVVTGELFLDNFELEFADAVTLTEAGGIVCEVRKVAAAPGAGMTMDKITLTAREY